MCTFTFKYIRLDYKIFRTIIKSNYKNWSSINTLSNPSMSDTKDDEKTIRFN